MSKRIIARLLAFALAATWTVALYGQEQGEQQQQSGQTGERGERMGGRRGPMSPEAELKRLTAELNLTQDQQDKIKPILEDQQKQMQDLRNDSSLEGQERFSKMREIRKSHMDQVRAILTSDQHTKFDDMQKRMMERGRRGPGGPGGEGGGNPPPPPPQV